jgi:hypothetical protein
MAPNLNPWDRWTAKLQIPGDHLQPFAAASSRVDYTYPHPAVDAYSRAAMVAARR